MDANFLLLVNQANFLLRYEVITMIFFLVTTKEKALGTDFNQDNRMLVIRLVSNIKPIFGAFTTLSTYVHAFQKKLFFFIQTLRLNNQRRFFLHLFVNHNLQSLFKILKKNLLMLIIKAHWYARCSTKRFLPTF